MAEKLPAASVQQFIKIKEIKDDVVVLKDNSLRAILMASSINFALKSVDEQDAIIYQYQGVLNSLDFPIQIMVASRKFNIEPYVQQLELKQKEQANELLRMQTIEYINFVQELTEITNIMTESFYVVIPYTESGLKKIGFGKAKLKKSKEQEETAKEDKQDFYKAKSQLWQRVDFIISALSSAGIKTVPLKTDELVELFYKLYNPSAKGELEIGRAKEMRLQ